MSDLNHGKVRFVSGGEELLDVARPLWLKLREHVIARSEHFSAQMSQLSWQERRKEILDKVPGTEVFVDLALDHADVLVGYCVSTITPSKQGEIDSIFVEEGWRGAGIGDQLMQRAEQWLDASGARMRTLEVTWGNEEVMGFYARRGFLPRRIVLQKKGP